MHDPPYDPPRDPLFDQVEEWRAEFDERWLVKFGRVVTLGFLLTIVVLVLVICLTGCDSGGHDELPAMPGRPPIDTAGIVSPSFTTTTSTSTTSTIAVPVTPDWRISPPTVLIQVEPEPAPPRRQPVPPPTQPPRQRTRQQETPVAEPAPSATRPPATQADEEGNEPIPAPPPPPPPATQAPAPEPTPPFRPDETPPAPPTPPTPPEPSIPPEAG